MDFFRFKFLLQHDSLFRSYFEVHLNLPVFSRRFTCVGEPHLIACNQSQEGQVKLRPHLVVGWVYQNRVPHFKRSPLFKEFLLARELSSACRGQFSFDSCESVSQFKRFLSGSDGYRLLHFALAVECLMVQTTPASQREMAQLMLELFMLEGSEFCLPLHMRGPVLETAGTTHSSMETSALVDWLRQCREQAMKELTTVWIKKFQKHSCNASPTTSMSEVNAAKKKALGKDSLVALVQSGKREVKKAGPPAGVKPAPPALSQAPTRDSPKVVPATNSGTPSLPPLTNSTTSITAPRGVPPTASQLKGVPPVSSQFSRAGRPLLKPDALPPLKQQRREGKGAGLEQVPEQPSATATASGGSRAKSHRLSEEETSDILLSCLQSDWWAGGPLLEHLLKTGENRSINCLLYWQSVQYLLLQESTPPHKRSNPLLHPDLHRFIAPYSTSLEDLVDLHICSSGRRRLLLPPSYRRTLLSRLPQGLDRGLLELSQTFAAQEMLKPWQQYLLADWESFRTGCCISRRPPQSLPDRSPAPPQGALQALMTRVYGSQGNLNMWKAFAAAMLVSCHGMGDNIHPDVTTTRRLQLLERKGMRAVLEEPAPSPSSWNKSVTKLPPLKQLSKSNNVAW